MKDLISQLLKENPRDRLGVSYDDFMCFEKLRGHKYFTGIDFENINYLTPPINNYYHLADEQIEKIEVSEFNFEIKNDYQIIEPTLEKTITNFFVENYFNNSQDVKIVYESDIQKRSPWFYYNKRRLILFSNGVLEYWNPIKNILRGKVFLNINSRVRIIKDNIFELHTGTINWKFKVFFLIQTLNSEQAIDWCNKIQNYIELNK